MNRREKRELTKRLAEQYLRPNESLCTAEYLNGWREACRSCAVALGVYSEFVNATEKENSNV